MDQIAATISFYTTGLSYPAISGPIAAYALVLALKRDDRRLLLAFWSMLLVVHIGGFYLITADPGAFITPGFISCLATPVFAVSTALGLRIALLRLPDDEREDPSRLTWLTIGTILIPLMQVATVFVAVLVAPYL